jgi:Arc/MetJ-type ribon-helix-helix transcriptional regulator
MKSNTKSSITLPREELRLVNELQKKLRARSKVEVVRRGLYLLKETTDREAMRAAYAKASRDVRKSTGEELAELDGLSGEGLADEDE